MKIEIKAGPNAGQQHDIEGSTVVGRDPQAATLVIDDPEASRRHASLTPGGDGVVVEDLGSTNGTFVGGQRLEGTRNVGPGEEIRIGNTVIEVQSTIEATRMSPIPEAGDPDATAFSTPVPESSPPGGAEAPPPAPEPIGSPPAPEPAHEPPAPEPPAPEPVASEPPSPPPSFDQPTSEPPASPQAPDPVAEAPGPPAAPLPPPPAGGPPPPPGAGQGFGAPAQGWEQQGGYGQQQGYQQPPPQMGQPGGAMAYPGPGGPDALETRDSTTTWLLCIFTFGIYALIWFHKTNKGLQHWSRGRIDYNSGASLSALLLGGFAFGIPTIVALVSYMGRIRTAQQMAGLQPRAGFWGFFGRNLLFGYGYKWAQDQINEIAVRQPQY